MRYDDKYDQLPFRFEDKDRHLTQSEVDDMLHAHQLFIEGKEGGKPAHFAYQNISHIIFNRKDLSNVNFFRCKFVRAEFLECELIGADFSYSNGTASLFRGCNMSRASFDHAHLPLTTIGYCTLDKVDMTTTNIDGADIHEYIPKPYKSTPLKLPKKTSANIR